MIEKSLTTYIKLKNKIYFLQIYFAVGEYSLMFKFNSKRNRFKKIAEFCIAREIDKKKKEIAHISDLTSEQFHQIII